MLFQVVHTHTNETAQVGLLSKQSNFGMVAVNGKNQE